MDFQRMYAYTEALAANNNRAWFHDNHDFYEQAREDFLMVLDVMKFVLAKYAPELGDELLLCDPKTFMYRIARDMRYSQGKPPYNPAFRAYLSPDKKRFLPISYFIAIGPAGCVLESGVWPFTAQQLGRLRGYIAINYEELADIEAEYGFRLGGERLKRVPRGFEPDHPATEWLKLKYFLFEHEFSPADCRELDSFAEAAGSAVRRMEPLRKYLAAAFNDRVYLPDEE